MAAPDAGTVDRVKSLSSWDQRPAVTEAEVMAAITAHPREDAEGLTVADGDAWTPSYDIPAAVAELWRIKAGRVAGDFTFAADGSSFNKGEVLAHCLEMEAKYAAMVAGSTRTTRYPAPVSSVVING